MRRKNKAEEELAARNDRWNKRKTPPSLNRPIGLKITNPTILIVCEGSNTEPSYFRQFRLSSATVTSIGEGFNTKTLVQRTKYLEAQGKYDQVWCVFDKDSFPDKDFNDAITIAERFKFGVAYSNQSFEYWLILHFDDQQGAGMQRTLYNDKINNLIRQFNASYDGKKSKNITSDFFKLLEGTDPTTSIKRVQLAINRAKRNLANCQDKSPAKQESSTTVFKLVEELLKYV